jgi:hypothetical protein
VNDLRFRLASVREHLRSSLGLWPSLTVLAPSLALEGGRVLAVNTLILSVASSIGRREPWRGWSSAPVRTELAWAWRERTAQQDVAASEQSADETIWRPSSARQGGQAPARLARRSAPSAL